jgi:antitoxin component YwqK of YwqJK toxin-antitoxin module
MPRLLFILTLLASLCINGQTTDDKGRKQGYWKKRDEKTQKLIYEGEFKDDKPVGRFRYYHPNDSLRAILNFRSDGETAYARLFHINGKRMAEGKYIQKEVKDSVWTYYDELGVLISRERYQGGKKDGASYVYFPDGKISEERHFKAGIQDGPFTQYFDGKLLRAAGTYVNGELEGKVRYLYPNGVEAAVGFYRNGSRNGPWVYRAKDGKITEKELYINGKQASKKETDAFFSKHKVSDKQSPSGQKAKSQSQKKK